MQVAGNRDVVEEFIGHALRRGRAASAALRAMRHEKDLHKSCKITRGEIAARKKSVCCAPTKATSASRMDLRSGARWA
jgi:hypothetical protein